MLAGPSLDMPVPEQLAEPVWDLTQDESSSPTGFRRWARLGREDLAQQVTHRAGDMCQPLPRYSVLCADSRRVIRSNSSVSGSPTSRPNSVSP